MKELLDLSVTPPVIVPTFLLMLSLVYWLMVVVGLFGVGSFDIGKDIDVDVDVDVDAHVDTHVEGEAHAEGDADGSHGGWGFMGFLKFLHVGQVPFMFWLTLFSLFFWAGMVLSYHYLAKEVIGLGLLFLIPGIIVSALLTKLFTWPFKGMYKYLNQDEKAVDYVGKICTLTTLADPDKSGQAEVKTGDKFLTIYVRPIGDASLRTGEQAVIVEAVKEGNYFLVTPFDD